MGRIERRWMKEVWGCGDVGMWRCGREKLKGMGMEVTRWRMYLVISLYTAVACILNINLINLTVQHKSYVNYKNVNTNLYIIDGI